MLRHELPPRAPRTASSSSLMVASFAPEGENRRRVPPESSTAATLTRNPCQGAYPGTHAAKLDQPGTNHGFRTLGSNVVHETSMAGSARRDRRLCEMVPKNGTGEPPRF